MATLVYSDADGVDHSFALGPDPVVVGRDAQCAIRSNDPRVSRHHARFYVDSGALWVEDLGSSNGIFVGPNRVQKAPVPTGEIVLIGSLLIRLLPASGTLPPPIGLHGTLATWLDLERKTRAHVEEERDAFARRVGELHQTIAALKGGGETLRPSNVRPDYDDTGSEVSAADRTAVGMEEKDATALVEMHAKLEEAELARKTADEARQLVERESLALREELDKLKLRTSQDLESARTDLAKLREQSMVAQTQAGMDVVEKMVESDMVISRLEREVEQLRAAAATSDPAVKKQADQLTTLTAQRERLEKELAAAQIRAQGAERNLSGATAQAAKAETRAMQAESALGDEKQRVAAAEAKHDTLTARISELETRLGAGEAPLAAAQAETAKIAADLAAQQRETEAARAKVTALEGELAAVASAIARAKAETASVEDKLRATSAEAAAAVAKQVTAESKLADLSAQLAEQSGQLAEQRGRLSELASKPDPFSERRVGEAEQRAAAADTMAKSMAKDVAEALRRAADADQRVRQQQRDVQDAQRRGAEADERIASADRLIGEANQRAEAAEERAKAIDAELTARHAAEKKDLADKLAASSKEAADKLAATQREAADKLAAVQKEAADKLAATQSDLGDKLADAHRELDERLAAATATSVDQMSVATQELAARLETSQRELAAERSGLLTLVDRKTQLERDLSEAKEAIGELERELEESEGKRVEAERLVGMLNTQVETLQAHNAQLEAATASSAETSALATHLDTQLRDALVSRETLEAALAAAQKDLAEAKLAIDELNREALAASDRLVEVTLRATEAERVLEQIRPSAEQADLAIGRSGALQRQLDEALLKLSWLERDAAGKDSAAKALADAEAARLAVEQRAHEAALEADAKFRDLQEKLDEAVTEIAEARRRLIDAERRSPPPPASDNAAQRALVAEQKVAMQAAQLAALQKEVSAAENVRSFAAETEREIAQLQRDLREARSKLTQVQLERDRLALDTSEEREDTNTHTTSRPSLSPRPQADGETTRQGEQVVILAMEHLTVIEEAVESLRANMRAASDETAMMMPSPPVTAVEEAVSAAAEHVERARAAIRAMHDVLGM